MRDKALKPVHPGEILEKDFLEPLAITQYRLAHDIHVPPRRINEIVHGKRGVSADTALRLARYFNTSPDVWLNLQTRFELETARLTEGREIERNIRPIPGLSLAVA